MIIVSLTSFSLDNVCHALLYHVLYYCFKILFTCKLNTHGMLCSLGMTTIIVIIYTNIVISIRLLSSTWTSSHSNKHPNI
ncbi:hypothetical protein EUGRSUZ_K02936 [Eucalyptus grandis]|uniref:Uncharacterized protein n=2 Tax=Eucalyptus grandis TaxID=71139 RepID=A0ACC3J011_EUCGR|nr:hypothetical protein EUGRSUZ_K02936 [Eucalyptus grandis]